MSDQSSMSNRTFTVATDNSLSELIRSARDRILFVAPGITEHVAKALVLRLSDPRLTITVILDNDPEVYRLGYGTPEGLTILKEELEKNQFGLRCQPGIRIGVLVSDDKTLIYSPAPQLIEAGSTSVFKPNALFLEGLAANTLSESAGASDDTLPSESEIGIQALTRKDVESIQNNIIENPPEPFDLTQKARVYSSRLQYVEFTVEKYQLTKQTVPIPAYLMGLAGENQNQWRNSLHVLDMKATEVKLNITDANGSDKETCVNQKFLDIERKKIEKKFLIPVFGFGSVMFKNQQDEFEAAIEKFSNLLALYFEKIEEQLGGELLDLVSSVTKQLLPSVKANPPEEYKRFGLLAESDIEALLERDIEAAISIKTLLSKPIVKKIYKDIAYQSVRSDEFQKRLQDALIKAKVPPSIINDIFPECNAALVKGESLFWNK